MDVESFGRWWWYISFTKNRMVNNIVSIWASSLAELHCRSVVHRDISARNVLLTARWKDPFELNDGCDAKLGDLGLCCRIGEWVRGKVVMTVHCWNIKAWVSSFRNETISRWNDGLVFLEVARYRQYLFLAWQYKFQMVRIAIDVSLFHGNLPKWEEEEDIRLKMICK